jgi:phospholipid/cholesterol/gamma-HCH transport system substrate-binding protein
MRPFRERNTTVIGLIGFVVIALLLLAAFRADRLPIIGAGDEYKAQFAEIGGLKEGNEVRVAGVSVGNVRGIELKGDRVDVTFKLDKGTELGRDTGASIKIRTLLGAEYLALTPAGSGELEEGGTIPLSRTTPPYNVVQAFSDLSTTTDELDVDQVGEALDALAQVAARTPKEFRGAIKGVSDLSANLAARDEQINTLLVNLKKVSTVLNASGPDLERLFKDATVLFDAISARRAAVHRLLVSTTEISRELRALVKDVRSDLKPALTQLETVTDMLRRNEASLDEALRIVPGFAHALGNSLAVGPWWDVFIKVGEG